MISHEATIASLLILMEKGAVTLRLHDPATSRDPTERTEAPFVTVTGNGKTWRHPIEREFGASHSRPSEIALALGIAVDRVLRGDGPKQGVSE